MLTVGSLFSGIEGFGLGFERAGMRVVWHCEADDYCQRVIRRHWPDNPIYPDVRELRGDTVPWVNVLCGGFPCQDLSLAGRRAGIDGAQSGLWAEMFRVACELRPDYLVVENVRGLVTAGLDRVLGDLASGGFDAEWDCLPASAFGAWHIRRRFWLVAYPRGARRRQDAGGAHGDEGQDAGRRAQDDHEPDGDGQGRGPRALADPTGVGRGPRREGRPDPSREGQPEQSLQDVADADSDPPQRPTEPWAERDPWAAEPRVARMAHGIPHGLDRRHALGNALVPQIAEWIGQRIIDYEGGLT